MPKVFQKSYLWHIIVWLFFISEVIETYGLEPLLTKPHILLPTLWLSQCTYEHVYLEDSWLLYTNFKTVTNFGKQPFKNKYKI